MRILRAAQREIASLSSSFEDYVFDLEFEAEEVLKAISKLQNGKAAGPAPVSTSSLVAAF